MLIVPSSKSVLVYAIGLFPVMAANRLLLAKKAQAHSRFVFGAPPVTPAPACSGHHDLQYCLFQASPCAGSFHLPMPRLLLTLPLFSLTETSQQAQRQG